MVTAIPCHHLSSSPPPQVGYLSSWSAHAEYRRAHPGLEDPLVAFKQQLMETLHVADATESGAVLMKSTVPLILSKDPIILS